MGKVASDHSSAEGTKTWIGSVSLSKVTKVIGTQTHICLAPNPVFVPLVHADIRSKDIF